MRVAVLHNPRPPDAGLAMPDDRFEEYDSPATIDAIGAALAGLGVEPVPVVAGPRLPWDLVASGCGFVFNVAEGEGRRCRAAIPAAVCELLGLPYTGSDALTLAAAQDKAVARRIVAGEVAVARAVLVEDELVEEGGAAVALAGLEYPVIVKPNDEGSSKGIGAGSLCATAEAAAARCRGLRESHGCPALVEAFLPGVEVTVGVAGNGAGRRVLGAMEIAPVEAGPFVYGLREKRGFRDLVRYHVPPRLPQATLAALERDALAVCWLLGCRDLARVDFRLDAAGRPHFLECNPLPGLSPESGDIVLMTRGVVAYEALVQGVLLDASARLGVPIG